MSAATEKQENVSRLFFETYLKSGFSLTEFQQAELERKAFGKPGGIYPTATREWKENYYKQIQALVQYMVTYSVPRQGWVWSRGNGMMGFLNQIAVEKCGVSTLDNWNPMDIVGVVGSYESVIKNTCNDMIVRPTTDEQKVANRGILNEIMVENIYNNKLLPISLKFINNKERPGYEVSPDLQTTRIRDKMRHQFKIKEVTCDLQWNKQDNQWKSNQEISWKMYDDGGNGRKAISIKIQGRAFSSRAARENPQHEGTPEGAGAKLGKAAITELRSFVTGLGLANVPSPTAHPQIPKPGQPWESGHKSYWISLYNSLSSASVGGQPINFMSPGVYGEGMNPSSSGFAAALDAACVADEEGRMVTSDPKVPAGNRLTSKLWGLEWLKLYVSITQRGKWDAFTYLMYHSCKKELPGMGPFIKIAGR